MLIAILSDRLGTSFGVKGDNYFSGRAQRMWITSFAHSYIANNVALTLL